MNMTPSSKFSKRRFMKITGAALAGGVAASNGLAPNAFAQGATGRSNDADGNSSKALKAIDTFEPILSYDTAYNLQLALNRYQSVVDNGGWGEMSRGAYQLSVGKKNGHVRGLRKRLMAEGDLDYSERLSQDFDEDLDKAVRRFQARYALALTGKIDRETFFMFNVPAEVRLAQIKLNLQRVELLAGTLTDKYALVNIPAASIEAIEDGVVARRHAAIVGRIDRQTPLLSSKIHEINFNPYWNVPKSIIRRDIIKYMKEDPEYLSKYRIKILGPGGTEIDPASVDWNTEEAVQYHLRQEPGAENSMGHVKINFHNRHSVYLHDTPVKSLFGESFRFHSSGCVRVESVDDFVAWILGENDDWGIEEVQSAFLAGERLDVAVAEPVPIHTTYITAWANRQGAVSFRDDVYQFDAQGLVAMEG